jgi:xylan 1,4-beta-xylosidase
VFRMFSRMGPQRVSAKSDGAVDLDTIVKEGVRSRPDVSALASRDARRLTVLAWHYHDDDVPGPSAQVALGIEGLGIQQGTVKLQHFRVDADHSNAYTTWLKMGSPQPPSNAQYAALERASELARLDGPPTIDVDGGRAALTFTLPRQGVSLLVLEW